MRFNTQGLDSKTLGSYDIQCSDEDKLYQVSLYDSINGAAEEFNFMIESIIPGILQRKFVNKDGNIINVLSVEVRFPQFSADGASFLMTPFIARMTGQSYMCDIFIDYVEINQNISKRFDANGNGIQHMQLSNDKIISKKLGSFHCLIGCNRDICMIKPDEFKDLNEWKMMLSECPGSPGAYVINNGAEKVVINDEKLRTNVALTFKVKGDNPYIETRITCMDNSVTTLVKLRLGRKRPTIKVLLPHIKKQKHYPLYLTFYLLFYGFNNTTSTKYRFEINKFEELIALFAKPEQRDSIIAYLTPSKEKFFELFVTRNMKGESIIDDTKIRSYIHDKLGNQKTIGAEEDSKRFELESIAQIVTNELFIQCKSFKDKVANLCMIVCQKILCACGLRDFDSRDDWEKKRSGSIVGMICNYVSDTLVKDIIANTVDNNGFDFGKSEKRKESIVEARKCETMNAAMSEKNKITNQVDPRTTSIKLREVLQDQTPHICPAQTPEGETCGLQKNKSTLCHISNNQEYSLNRKLAIEDLLEPHIYYFTDKKDSKYKYKFITVDFHGRVFQSQYGLTQQTISTEGIYVSTRILNIFKEIFKQGFATYYIEDDTNIYVKFMTNVDFQQFAYKTHMGGVLFIAVPQTFGAIFEEASKIYKNPEYNQYSSLELNSECRIIIKFNSVSNATPMQSTVIHDDSTMTPLYVSKRFVQILEGLCGKSCKFTLNKSEKLDVADEVIVTSKYNLERFDYEHWTGKRVASMLPKGISVAFSKLIGVINDYFSTEKSKTYAYSFTFNGNVLTDSKKEGYIPKVIWSNGKNLTKYIKDKRRNGDLPYDSCVNMNENDLSIQYYDDAGRLMSPMLIVDDDGKLVIDKLGSYYRFTDRDFDNSKGLIESLYNEGSLELIDACEMNTALLAIDILECRTIYKLKRFLDSLDFVNLKSAMFKNKSEEENIGEKDNSYYRNEDIPTVKINGTNYDVEFTTVKPKFPCFEFTQNGITYYGTYSFSKSIYLPVLKKIYKLDRPSNPRLKDSYHMLYLIDGQMKFILETDDFMTDGNKIYIEDDSLAAEIKEEEGEDQPFKEYTIHYLNFPKGKETIYVDEDVTILDVVLFEKLSDKIIMYVHNGKKVDEKELVDGHFVNEIDKDGKHKMAVADEVHFPEGIPFGDSLLFERSKKISTFHNYIPITSIGDITIFNYDEDNKKPLDKREADLHMSIVRRHIDDISTIPDSYLSDHIHSLDEQFDVTSRLSELISLFGNKRILNILRRYIGTGFKFTHCLIDPNQAYSVVANFVPRADSNPGPRFSYQCSMGTQALGIGNCIWYRRYETSNKRLISPVEHPFETIAELPLNQVTMPTTQNFVIMVAANYKGYEDPIIISRSALLKFGRYEKEVCIKIIESSNRDYSEAICHPFDQEGNRKTGHIFRHLDDEGLPKMGSFIEVGDCVVGKIKKLISPDPNRRDKSQKIDSSYFAGVGDEGIVTDIVTIGSEGTSAAFRTIIVKLVQTRCQQVGDKMASRYSQKGTIGDIIGGMINAGDPRLKIVDDCLMPFVPCGPNKGLRAEIIFNPASFPSRMTAGLIKEILCAKSSLYLQEKVDATNFHKQKDDYYRNALYTNRMIDENEHMDINGDELMCHSDGEIIMDSTTGKPMKFYVGIVAYQFLRHHVADKETARATGSVKSITNQPNEGRKNRGGQRMGEMERDSLLSSGAAYTLFDRFMDASDGYEDVYCEYCRNNSAISSLKGKICAICGTAGSLVCVAEPRIYKVFHHQMNALGLEIASTVRPIDDFQADVSKAIKADVELLGLDEI